MKTLPMMLTCTLLLTACAPAMSNASTTPAQPTRAFNLTRQASAPETLKPNGSISVANSQGTTSTSVILFGLKPNTYYVGHYHVMGLDSKEPCTSNGAPILSSAVVGRSDGNGDLMMNGSVSTGSISNAAYFNIHTAAEASGAPADAGVACVPVTVVNSR
ncbi:hypothetical protein [Deinococcus peraridilitoris]|uniref:Copper/zinc superoxide dismutase (SODC) n=1 Tax=Deinococcus peraridilitoris (strain DSM 19664 / LMG 22246 / CIP 109416 / KR-200) TaxID=937777 RepID=L0A7Z3_DEIPD|nr:hypothetical protein [Deinococcus peraridilitoris]AFZ69554.1 hypothetical protein Deipe_4190 [Deinococcus peraridilitoris DSM 19664]